MIQVSHTPRKIVHNIEIDIHANHGEMFSFIPKESESYERRCLMLESDETFLYQD